MQRHIRYFSTFYYGRASSVRLLTEFTSRSGSTIPIGKHSGLESGIRNLLPGFLATFPKLYNAIPFTSKDLFYLYITWLRILILKRIFVTFIFNYKSVLVKLTFALDELLIHTTFLLM